MGGIYCGLPADNTLWGNSRKEKVDPGSVTATPYFSCEGTSCYPTWPSSLLLLPFSLFSPLLSLKLKCSSSCSVTLWSSLRTDGKIDWWRLPGVTQGPWKAETPQIPKCSLPTAVLLLNDKSHFPSVSALRRLSPNSHNPSASHWPPYPASRQR